jgi:hypothetical protein
LLGTNTPAYFDGASLRWKKSKAQSLKVWDENSLGSQEADFTRVKSVAKKKGLTG